MLFIKWDKHKNECQENRCDVSCARVGINHLISHTIPSPAPASRIGQSEPPLAPVSSGPGPESDTGLRTDSGSDHRSSVRDLFPHSAARLRRRENRYDNK